MRFLEVSTKFFATIFSISILSSTSLHAQEVGFAGEINYAEIADVSGAEVGIGAHFSDGPLRISPIIGGFIYAGELEGFRRESSSICRNTSNGQFADSENCDATETDFYGKLEISFLADSFEFGAGYRYAEEQEGGYGLIGYRSSENLSIRATAGTDYFSVGLAFRQ